ncbi:hypothetical protein, partial [Klebsiella pneumoniae]|uniref:hypothetical protein n=1 Tax=Klebsiella pneumoniae TaxID=573 RepID=UPI00296AD65A
SLKTSIKTITYLSDIGCLEIQGASLTTAHWITPVVMYSWWETFLRYQEYWFREATLKVFQVIW